MKIYAHRGYSAKYPENTILAFEKAWEAGADGIELDVRVTKDGQLVVFHDNDLKRLFDIDKKIEDLEYCELRKFELEGQKVPTLEEVLSTVPENGLLIVEIKDERAAREAVCRIIPKGLQNRTIFSSFNTGLITELIKEFPDLNFAFILGEEHKDANPQKLLENILLHRPHSVHIPRDAYDIFGQEVLKFMDFLRENSIEIFLWNINQLADFETFKDHIDAVITDEVELFLDYRHH